jgi:hypothetical protein
MPPTNEAQTRSQNGSQFGSKNDPQNVHEKSRFNEEHDSVPRQKRVKKSFVDALNIFCKTALAALARKFAAQMSCSCLVFGSGPASSRDQNMVVLRRGEPRPVAMQTDRSFAVRLIFLCKIPCVSTFSLHIQSSDLSRSVSFSLSPETFFLDGNRVAFGIKSGS